MPTWRYATTTHSLTHVYLGLAWIIIPSVSLNASSPTFSYSSWRIFLAICTLPALTSALFFYLMPESPRFLLNSGKEEEALIVLRKMFELNNSEKNRQMDFPIVRLRSSTIVKIRADPTKCAVCYECNTVGSAMSELFERTADLFRAPLTKVSIILVIIYFTLSFGYYGLFMWFPELFSQMEKTGGSPCSPGNVSRVLDPSGKVKGDIYMSSFITNASNLPGNLVTFLLIDRIKNGRNILLSTSMVAGGMCVFFIAMLQTQTQSLVMSCIFSGITVISWNSLDVIGMELYPTHLRSTATGFQMGIGRIAAILANVIFGELVDVYCLVPMLMVATFMTVGGLCSCMLPNMQNKDVDSSDLATTSARQ